MWSCPSTYYGVYICGGFLDASLYSDTTSWNISNSTGVDVNEHFAIKMVSVHIGIAMILI